MTKTQWVFLACSVIVVVMLIHQFLVSDAQREQVADHAQTHFFFTQTPSATKPAPAPSPDADVKQSDYEVQDDTPPGNFTCQVTLKNVGQATAHNVEIVVRPFRGALLGSGTVGHTQNGILSDNDPLAQLNDTLTFPDLAPGAQSTQSAVFLKRINVTPGNNPKPEISFESAKTNPAP